MTDMNAESVKIFENVVAATKDELVVRCIPAYAEALAANICVLKDSREEALAYFDRLRTDIERAIAERFDHYRDQLDEADLFGEAPTATVAPVPVEPALPAEPEAPLVGWPRARALRDTADVLASCRDSGDQVAIGCVYSWMRDLIVETLRAESAVLTDATVADWNAEAAPA